MSKKKKGIKFYELLGYTKENQARVFAETMKKLTNKKGKKENE